MATNLDKQPEIGLILVTHEGIGDAMLKAVHQAGHPCLDCVSVVSVVQFEATNLVRERLLEAIERADEGAGVLLLIDQYGGTPANQTGRLIESLGGRISGVCGLNLPMLIRVLTRRDSVADVRELVRIAIQAGMENVAEYDSLAHPQAGRTEGSRTEDLAAAPIPTRTTNRTGTLERTLVIQNKRGLHLSAASKIVHAMGRYDATVHLKRNDTEVDAKSILGVTLLTAPPGAEITVRTAGPDADEAMREMERLFVTRFGEEE